MRRAAPGAAGRAVAVSIAVALAVFGSFLLLVTPEFADRPGLQTLWVVLSLVLLKVPLLGLVWWLITRRRRTRLPEWDADRAARHLAELSAEAEGLTGTPAAAARLDALSADAWRTAERADPSVTPAAVELALRLDRLRRRDRSPAGRSPAHSGEKLPK
jgi:hypothetical protein